MTTDVRGRYHVAAAEKTMRILESLASGKNAIGLADLSRVVGMPKPTLFRYLSTLEPMGYVRKDAQSGWYRLGLGVFELGSRGQAMHTVREMALPEMHSLLDRFAETVNLAVMDGGQVLYLEMLESPHALRMSAQVGTRDHAHSTSLGKAMLAHLPEAELDRIVEEHGLPPKTENTITTLNGLKEELGRIREMGYAIDREENEPMVGCVGAAIVHRLGFVDGAISVSGPLHRMPAETMEQIGQSLREATSRISQMMQQPKANL